MYVVAHNGARLWGGAEIATARLLAGLRARGHRVLLLCNDARVRDGARALGVPAQIAPLGGDVALHDALMLARWLRRERPDAFIIGTFKKMWLAALAARMARVPRVVARVGLETDTPRSAKYRWVLARGWVHAVVVNAARMRAPFLALPGWSAERVVIIHNGVAALARPARPGALRAALGIAPAAPVIGSVGRLARQKRFDRLLEALARLPAETHCILAGEGDERPLLEARARALGIAPRVHLLGHREDLGDVLAALDVYAVSSDREGMSNAMLEALATGVPVVSTPVSGADEALAPLAPGGEAPGRITRSFDAAELAAALAAVLADAPARVRMGEAARRTAAARFSQEATLDRWEALLAPAGAPRDLREHGVEER